jgi:hypothetical protein
MRGVTWFQADAEDIRYGSSRFGGADSWNLQMPREEPALSKAYPIPTIAVRIERQARWRWVRRAARAVLRALQESRARAARKVIHDYRHLLEK